MNKRNRIRLNALLSAILAYDIVLIMLISAKLLMDLDTKISILGGIYIFLIACSFDFISLCVGLSIMRGLMKWKSIMRGLRNDNHK